MEDAERYASLTEIVKLIIDKTQDRKYEIDWNLVSQVVEDHKGIPVAIGMHIPEMQAAVESKSIEVSKIAIANNDGVNLRLETEIRHDPE